MSPRLFCYFILLALFAFTITAYRLPKNETGVSLPPLPWVEDPNDWYPWADNNKAESRHAIFRLFSPDAEGYLRQSNYTSEILADGENPFDPDLEYEWIPQLEHKGAYLRSKSTGKYICFNRHGRPTARPEADPDYCLLHGKIPRSDLLSVRQKKKPSGYGASRHDPHPRITLPAPIHLVLRSRNPDWYVGFCTNGRTFANLRPHAKACHGMELTRAWNVLYVCHPIAWECREPICTWWYIEGMPENTRCPEHCRTAITCGGVDTTSRVYF